MQSPKEIYNNLRVVAKNIESELLNQAAQCIKELNSERVGLLEEIVLKFGEQQPDCWYNARDNAAVLAACERLVDLGLWERHLFFQQSYRSLDPSEHSARW